MENLLRGVARGIRLKGRKSHTQNLKPRDLCLARMKPSERTVEVRKGADVQFVPLSWV